MSNNQPQSGMDTLKHDYRRGEIIRILKQTYPHLLTFRMIQLTLFDGKMPIGNRDLFSYLSYLEERSFIRTDRYFDRSEGEERIGAAGLTASGLLLHDRKISDPGVRL